ncbi:MAG: hypothetical protein IPJ13_17815 [Saprospiraceae bacterium]|nr:hypothetical protein [Saprospiraceae bacterium]
MVLVIQMHYAPWSVDEADSSSVNIFFYKNNEVIDRTGWRLASCFLQLSHRCGRFVIQANQVKSLAGVYLHLRC